jgi:predicted DNA-binding transcriptional regulator YafY
MEMVREGTQSGYLANSSDFREELGISRRTVARDLDFLRDEENAPIEYDESRKGYLLTDESYSLPPIRLSRKEVFSFSIARKLLGAFEGTPLELDMRSTLAKIEESLEGSISIDIEGLTENLSVISEDHVILDPELWAAVAKYTSRSEQVRMTYRKFNGETKKYMIEPYHLFAYHGNWYLLARREDTEKPWSTFAISRIRKISGTGILFEVDHDFDAKQHIKKAFGISQGTSPFRVRLLFDANIATYIEERVWHSTQKMKRHRDGRLEMEFETTGWKELVRWILSWQPDVEVLMPKRLRERIGLKMRQALART